MICSSVVAADPRIVSFETQDDFVTGRTDGIRIDWKGRLLPGGHLTSIGQLDTVHSIWAVLETTNGDVIFGTGTDGGVRKIGRGLSIDSATTLLDLPGAAVHSLARLSNGTVLAGTAPDGRISSVTPDGTTGVFLESGQGYVWAIEEAENGNIWVACGSRAVVLRCSRDGEIQRKWDLPADHARCLTLQGKSVWIGTSNPGGVYCITPDDDIRTIYAAQENEISSIRAGDNGVIWFSGVNALSASSSDDKPESNDPARASNSNRNETGAIYRIDRDLSIERWWITRNGPIYNLVVINGRPIAACGPKGHLYEIMDAYRADLIAAHGKKPILSMFAGPGTLTCSTGGPGELVRVTLDAPSDESSYESRVLSYENTTRWGRIGIGFRPSDSIELHLETRSGNSVEPDEYWSEWTTVDMEGNSGPITSPPAMNLQWRMKCTPGNRKPIELSPVSISSTSVNRKPRLSDIRVYPVSKGVFADQQGGNGKVFRQEFDDGLKVEYQIKLRGVPDGFGKGEWFKLRGMRTVAWEASDPDNDKLVFDIAIAPERDMTSDHWTSIERDYTSPILSFDSTSFPDGKYVIRVTATDLPSNPKNTEKTADILSRPFRIDNSPPSVSDFSAHASDDPPAVIVEARVSDQASRLRSFEYSTDADVWYGCTSRDGIIDTESESIHLVVAPCEGPEIFLRITDEHENSATFSTRIRSGGRTETKQ